MTIQATTKRRGGEWYKTGDSVIAYWPFTDDTRDYSGNGNNVELFNDAEIGGEPAEFKTNELGYGKTNTIITVPASFTLCGWVIKPIVTTYAVVFNMTTNAGDGGGFNIYYRDYAGGKIYVSRIFNLTHYTWSIPWPKALWNVRTFFALSYTAGNWRMELRADNNTYVYTDAQEMGTSISLKPSFSGNVSYNLRGSLSQFGFYNEVLAPSEIDEIHEKQQSYYPQPPE